VAAPAPRRCVLPEQVVEQAEQRDPQHVHDGRLRLRPEDVDVRDLRKERERHERHERRRRDRHSRRERHGHAAIVLAHEPLPPEASDCGGSQKGRDAEGDQQRK
jgi:hypothetical protein